MSWRGCIRLVGLDWSFGLVYLGLGWIELGISGCVKNDG